MADTATADTRAALVAHGTELATLAERLRVASGHQWERAPIMNRDDVDRSRRASGDIPDPTAFAVGDPRRLRLRVAVIGAEKALAVAADSFRECSAELTRAIEAWEG